MNGIYRRLSSSALAAAFSRWKNSSASFAASYTVPMVITRPMAAMIATATIPHRSTSGMSHHHINALPADRSMVRLYAELRGDE